MWAHEAFCLSGGETEMVKVPRILMERLTDTLCYVAWLGKVQLTGCLKSRTKHNTWGGTWLSFCVAGSASDFTDEGSRIRYCVNSPVSRLRLRIREKQNLWSDDYETTNGIAFTGEMSHFAKAILTRKNLRFCDTTKPSHILLVTGFSVIHFTEANSQHLSTK